MSPHRSITLYPTTLKRLSVAHSLFCHARVARYQVCHRLRLSRKNLYVDDVTCHPLYRPSHLRLYDEWYYVVLCICIIISLVPR